MGGKAVRAWMVTGGVEIERLRARENLGMVKLPSWKLFEGVTEVVDKRARGKLWKKGKGVGGWLGFSK